MKVKVTNTSRVEQKIRSSSGVEAISPGKTRPFDLDQAEIELIRTRRSLEVQEVPIEDAVEPKPPKKAKAKT
jgi:hypothetical protein